MKNNKTWAVGAMAAIAGTNAADAIVQITINDTVSNSTAGTTVSITTFDLTGDGSDDISPSKAAALVNPFGTGGNATFSTGAGYMILTWSGTGIVPSNSGAVGATGSVSGTTGTLGGLFPISFTDAGINGGNTVNAWLDVHLSVDTATDTAEVSIERVIWDETNPSVRPAFNGTTFTDANSGPFVPEPSSLALLALGAGGLLSRRRRAA